MEKAPGTCPGALPPPYVPTIFYLPYESESMMLVL